MEQVSTTAETDELDELSEIALDYVRSLGACEAGIATIETLEGGPPSTDLTYVLPDAKSAISFAVPFDQSLIPPYLSKKDREAHEKDNVRSSTLATGISHRLADFLKMKGHPSVGVAANDFYRADQPLGMFSLIPPLAHRYLAVRSGVGWFGMSGNVITKREGAAVYLGSMVTSAALSATEPLPPEESYCDRCGMCLSSCVGSFFDPKEDVEVTLGGLQFSYSKRRDYNRCGLVCGGFTGLHPSGKWSTWSPGRVAVPKKDDELGETMMNAFASHSQWPKVGSGFYNGLAPAKLWQTCGNCQLVCVPNKDERKRRKKMLRSAGVVIQNQDGSLEAVPAETGKERIASMSPERRALYGGS